MRIAVIGAGISGLACGQDLKRAGHEVVIIEKSRGIGGRIATRRTPEDLRFDHGAQFFTVQSRAFRQFLAGDAKRWDAAGAFEQTRDWFIGCPDIKSFLRPVAKTLDIRLNCRAEKLERIGDDWTLHTDTEVFEGFDHVVVTAPAPQAAALTEFSDVMQEQIAKAEMAPCWTIMLAFKEPVEKDFDVLKLKNGNLDWLARNSSKYGRKERPDCWVAHATAAWSAENLELGRDAALQALLPDILASLGRSEDDLIYFSAHRWRYANVTKPVGELFIQDETGTLFAAGDWCAGTCVEHAFDSGIKLAAHLNAL